MSENNQGAASGGDPMKRRRTRRSARRTAVVAAVIALVTPAILGGVNSGSPVTAGVSHVNDTALNGSATSGFEGAATASGLDDDATAVAEYADSLGLPAEIVLALVAKSTGPWRADGADTTGNARKVADALAAARTATSASGGWDMLTGTIACNGDVLVVQGSPCPDGTQTDPGDGARRARLVREAWVAALMGMGEGLDAPKTSSGSAGGDRDALAAPDELEGEPADMIMTLATSTYGLDTSAVSTDGDLVTVFTSDPLPLATTIASRAEQIRVSRLEAAGQSWDRDGGWRTIEPEAGAGKEDPTAAGHVRVWTCTQGSGPDCTDEAATTDPVHLTREQADAIYTTALTWRLGGKTSACSTSTTVAASTATSTVESVTSSTSGEEIEITPARAGYVAAVIAKGRQMGIGDDGIIVALMTVLQESRLNMYANSGNAESLTLPHDAVGSDHDSVGLFFERLGPWMSAHPGASHGEAAQGVQVSAFPDAYDQWEEAARALAGGVTGSGGASAGCTRAVTGSGWRYPIVSVGTITSDWDPARMHPVLGYARPHWGTDIGGLPLGTELVAVAPGVVSYAACDSDGLCQVDYDTDDG